MKKHFLFIVWLVNLAVILWLWRSGSAVYLHLVPADIFIVTGRLAGLMGMFLILTQLALISRVQFLERLYGFDTLNRYHRKIGWVALALLLFHPLALSLGYSMLYTNFSIGAVGWQLVTFINSWEDVFPAFLGVVTLIIIVCISWRPIRKLLRYETWYFVHVLIYLVIALVFLHQIQTADVSSGFGLYYWLTLNIFVFSLVLFYRFLRPLWLFKRHNFHVEHVIQETPTVWSVYVTGKNIEKFSFEAGQYANLFFLARGRWYAHPFSFSTGPTSKIIRFSIKKSGDFTNTISHIHRGMKVLIDGPLGGFTLRHAVTNKFLFIAGGIGITPIRALLEMVQPERAYLLYGARSVSELAFEREIVKLGIRHKTFLSHAEAGDRESGFIDQQAIERFVPDVAERDVYICGTPGMTHSVVCALKALGVPSDHIHYENFAY